ncbi:hypothetical protein BKA63DRAFT_28431 [Paraphoma chrysanthemicola]|nr:hypothetical protein BKA63DRAFT_28431 [Paraphoma chrysanthemicola]
MRSFSIGLAALFAAQHVYAQGKCYNIDGKLLPNDPVFYNMFQPCTSGGPSTICCATNRSNQPGGDAANGDTQDECLSNGLCQNRVTKNGVESTKYFLNFCTNSNLSSSDCLNVCEQTRGNQGNTEMTPCTGKADSERWCCGGGNTACCSTGVGLVTLAKNFGGIVVSSSIATSLQTSSTAVSQASTLRSASTAGSSTSSPSLSGTNAPASSGSSTPASTSNNSSSSSALSGGAIAGIVVGAIAGLALLAAAIFFAIRANKYKKAAAGHTHIAEAPANPPQYGHEVGNGAEKYAQGQTQWQQQQQYQAPVAEMQHPPSELPGGLYGGADQSPYTGHASPEMGSVGTHGVAHK